MTTSITSSTTQTIISAGGNPSALVIENGGIVSGIGKNKIINGNFAINQRAVSGTVVLAAGDYGHDRFKAGAAGCTYTFATLENITTITISAGSLIQVIEGLNLFSGNVVLSWTGTAQGKIGAGAYGNSGVTGTAVGGTNLSVEFNTGTLSLVQLETGSYKSAFEHRPYGMELSLCQRYYQYARTYSQLAGTYWVGWDSFHVPQIQFPVTMRAAPTTTVGVFESNSSHNYWTNPGYAPYSASSPLGWVGASSPSHIYIRNIRQPGGGSATPTSGLTYFFEPGITYTVNSEL